MTVTRLPRVHPPDGPEPELSGPEHPMRRLTLELAFGGEWNSERAAEIRRMFDDLAPEWHTRDRPERYVPISDALERGGPWGPGVAVELGSGTGIATDLIAGHLPRLVAVDLSMEMLRLAPATVPRVRADGAHLPFLERSIDTLVLVNMLLFPSEVDRVVASSGAVMWVNTSGPQTPIYLSAEEVQSALGGGWDVVASSAGPGSWCVARRSK